MRPLFLTLMSAAVALLTFQERLAAAVTGAPDPAQSTISVVGNTPYVTVGGTLMIRVLLKDSAGNVLRHNISLKQTDGKPATVQFVPGPPFSSYSGTSFSVTSNTAGLVTFVPVDTDTGTTLDSLRASIEFTLPHTVSTPTPNQTALPSTSPSPTISSAAGIPDASKSSIRVEGNSSAPADGKTPITIVVNLHDANGTVIFNHTIGLKQVAGSSQLTVSGARFYGCCTGPADQTVPNPYGGGDARFLVTATVAHPVVTFVPQDITTGTTLSSLPVTISFGTAGQVAADIDPSKSTVVVAGTLQQHQSAGNVWYDDWNDLAPGNSAPADGKTAIRVDVTLRNSSGAQVGGSVTLRQVNGSAALSITPVQPAGGHTAVFRVTSTTASPNVTLIADVSISGYPPVTLSYLPARMSFTALSERPTPRPAPTHGSVISANTPAPAPTPKVVVAPRPSTCAPHSQQEIVDEPIGQFFCFAGLNLRVDSVQTVEKADNSPLLTKNINTQPDPELGYIVVKVTMQNRSNFRTQNYPTNWLGFDLTDGSKIELQPVNAEYAGPDLSPPPEALASGQTIQATYVVVNWNRSPVRTMYLFRNVGNGENDPGVQYARFAVGTP